MTKSKLLLLCFLCGFMTEQAIAQHSIEQIRAMQSEPLTYSALKVNERITVDGKAEEAVWDRVAWSSDFVDIRGSQVQKPAYPTKLKMLWDNQYLYIYAQLEEPHIWADIDKHDEIIYLNNDFEVFIKPFMQHATYYEIEVNPLNTILDLVMTKPYRFNGEALIHWDLKGLKSAVHNEGTLNNAKDKDKYWSVEMAIPFESILSFGKSKTPPLNSYWQINFSRVQWQHVIENGIYQRKKINGKFVEEDNWVWSPIGIINMHYPERWGYVQFVDSLDKQAELPAAYEIKKLAWNIHYLQQLHFNSSKKYADDLKKLKGYEEFIASEISNYEVDLTTGKQFDFYRITLKNKHSDFSLMIDSKGNTN